MSATAGNLSTNFTVINMPGPPKTITVTSGGGQSAQITTAFTNALVATVKDVGGNLVSGASVTFTAPGAGASLTFAGGGKTATVTTDASGLATSPTMTANGTVGAYSVTAATNGLSTTFGMTNTAGPPASITVVAGTTPQSTPAGEPFATKLSVTVADAGGNPASGVSVTFSAPLNGASALFGNTATAIVTTNTFGVATVPLTLANLTQGSYNVTATAGNLPPVTFSLTNTLCALCPSVSMPNVSVGQNLQLNAVVTLSQPAGPSGTSVTLISSDPTKLLVSGRSIDAGSASVTVPIPSGASQSGIFVQSLVSTGSASLTISAPGYVFKVSTVTFTPSGFVLSIPSQPASNNLVTPNGADTTIVVQPYQLDASLKPMGVQSVRGGFPVSLDIANSNPSVGAVTPAPPLAVASDNTPISLQFSADTTNTGATTLTAGVPTGFSAAATGNAVNVTVFAAALAVTQADPTIGKNLQTTGQVLFGGGGSELTDTFVTITSSDATKLLFSTTATGVGSASITVKIPAGFSKSANYFIQSLANSGTVNYTAQATGFPTLTATATLAPSGILISGPGGLGNPLLTTTQSAPSTITVKSEVLDSGMKPVNLQAVAGGMTVTANVTSADATVGTITVSPVTIASNTSSTTTQFQPNASSLTGGTTTINVDVPPGFSAPASGGSVSAVVKLPGMSLSASTNHATIGKDLQIQDSVILGAPAPAGGLQMTITSNDATRLLVALNPTDAGAASITFTIPAGGTSASYFLQALANSGTQTYTATASLFTSQTGTISMGNSGVALAGPLGLGTLVYNTTVAAGPSTFLVYTALLDASSNYVQAQSLRSGLEVDATVTSSITGVGTIASPVIITGGGATSTATAFTPVASGSTNVTLSLPVNLGLANNNKAVIVTVH